MIDIIIAAVMVLIIAISAFIGMKKGFIRMIAGFVEYVVLKAGGVCKEDTFHSQDGDGYGNAVA